MEITKEVLEDLRSRGVSVKDIAKKFNTSESTIFRRLKEFGLTSKTDRSDITVDMVVKEYNFGFSANEIAKRLNTSIDTILKRLKVAGIEVCSSENIKKHFIREHEKLWSDIEKDLNNKMRKKDICKKYHIRDSSLNRMINMHGYVRKFIGNVISDDILFELENMKGTNKYKIKKAYLKTILDFYETYDRLPTVSELSVVLGKRYVSVNEFLNKHDLKKFIDIQAGEGRLVKEFERFLKDLGVSFERNNRKILNGKEIDFWCENENIGFEINPTSSHSVDGNIYFKKPKKYHFEKAKSAFEKKIPLIQIYDIYYFDDRKWNILKEMITYRLKPEMKLIVGARKCKISEISRRECNLFLNRYHLQGEELNSTLRYGLYLDEELVSVMTFGNSRFEDGFTEIIRYCTKPNIGVTGGFKKLFSKRPKGKIVSYFNLDMLMSVPTVYERNGFTKDDFSELSYFWINENKSQVLSRYSVQKNKRDKLFPDDKGLSENKCMLKHGFKRIFTSGNVKYTYL